MKISELVKTLFLRKKKTNRDNIIVTQKVIEPSDVNNHQDMADSALNQNESKSTISKKQKAKKRKKIRRLIIATLISILTPIVTLVGVTLQNKSNYETTKHMIYQEHIPRFVFFRRIDCDDINDVYDAYGTYMLSEELLIEIHIELGEQESANKYYLFYTRKQKLRNLYMRNNFELILLQNAGEGSAFGIDTAIDPTCSEYSYNKQNSTTTQCLVSIDTTSEFEGNYIEPVIPGDTLAILLTCNQYEEAQAACYFNITLTYQDLYGNPYNQKFLVYYIPEVGEFFYKSLDDFQNNS